jgi:bifunctional oligoribonuclease and PAP phosphatase NrnA
VCPEGISASTKQLLENLGIPIPDAKLPEKFDIAILVDTNTLEQLGTTGQQLLSSGIEIVVVDHHHPHPDTAKIASQLLVDEYAAAAAEIVYRLFRTAKASIDPFEARTLLAAIFIETKHFLLARESTFTIAAALVKAGADPRHLSDLLSSSFGRSERIARLKAAGRSQVTLMGDWIVATAELGSYQSSAARALLGLGAHVAFVAGGHGEKSRVNMRATENFYDKAGVHLARDVAIPIGKKLGGTGGGHATAAGLSAPTDSQSALTICLDSLKEALGPLQT